MAQEQIYKIVTERICDLLEAGVNPWRKSWTANVPRSIHGREYRGFNAFILAMSSHKSPFWSTYKEAKKRGGHVRKGEKSTPILFWKWIKVIDKTTKKEKKIPFVKYFRVFNLDQIEGIDADKMPVDNSEQLTDFQKVEKAEEILSSYFGTDDAPALAHGGGRAFYRPMEDLVQMPVRESFDRESAYYSVAFHEMGHSTGAEKRLNRPGVADFDAFASHSYGKEELIAEMTAAFLNAICGIEAEENNSAAYLQSWLKTISGDPKMVVQAAQAAQKSADLIQGIKHTYEKESETSEGETAAQAA